LIQDTEQQTRDTFGDYVSIYNFKQSVDDGATVPLYYENRVPRVQLADAALNDSLNAVLDDAALDAEQGEVIDHAENLSPQEQCATAFGFVTLNPPFCRSSL